MIKTSDKKQANQTIAKKARSKAPKKETSRAQGWRLTFNVLLLLIWVFASVIVAQLAVGYLMLWILGRENFVQTVPTAIYSVLSFGVALAWILFATPRIIAKFKHGKKGGAEACDRKDLGLAGLPTWTDIGLAPVGFIIATLLAAALVACFNFFPWFEADQAQELGFNTYLTGIDRIVAFIVLVIVAPVVEELIYRGWLYGKLRSMLSEKMSDTTSMIISIFLVSLLFGIAHMQLNVGVNVFALSIVLCGMREITGTIYAGILTHMIKNGLAFYLIYVLGIA